MVFEEVVFWDSTFRIHNFRTKYSLHMAVTFSCINHLTYHSCVFVQFFIQFVLVGLLFDSDVVLLVSSHL